MNRLPESTRERLLRRWRADPTLTTREIAALFGIGVATAARLRRIALGVDLVACEAA